MSSSPHSSMGTFSVRNLRADIQNVTTKSNRSFPSLTRFIALYLFLCLAFYLYFRYYLTDDSDYGIPRPAAVIHENTYRPLKALPSSYVPAKELFVRLTDKFARQRIPHVGSQFESQGSRARTGNIVTGLEMSLKDYNRLQASYEVPEEENPENLFNLTDTSFRVFHASNATTSNVALIGKNLTSDTTNGSGKMTVQDNNTIHVKITHHPEVMNISSILQRLQDFRREWLRQRRARVDWQSMLRPCVDNMAWRLVKQGWGKLNRTNARSSEIIFWDIRPAGEFSKVLIQSKTADNRTKAIGGDTWRVYLRGPASIAATVFDHNNGSYEALFLVMEPGVYLLEIYLDYSLCDGFRDPPRDWFIVGNAQGKYQKDGLLGTLDDYLLQPFNNGDPLIVSVPPRQLNTTLMGKLTGLETCANTCQHLWDGFGRWVKGKWEPYLKESYKWRMPLRYERSGTFWVYGDSLAVRLVDSVARRPLCQELYRKCQRSYNWIYPVESEVLSKEIDDNLDFRPAEIIKTIVDVLNREDMQQEDSAFLLNLGIHFTTSINFTTYQKLVDDVIAVLNETTVNSGGERVPRYKAKVIWKSSTAVHKENAKKRQKTNWRFFTTQRVALFNTYALSAMCKAGFDVVDVFHLTDSYPLGSLDAVHYIPSVFSTLEKMLEKYKVHNNNRLGNNAVKQGIRHCIGERKNGP